MNACIGMSGRMSDNPLVLYECRCGRYSTITQLYYCVFCAKVLCSELECTTCEVSSYYDPFSLVTYVFYVYIHIHKKFHHITHLYHSVSLIHHIMFLLVVFMAHLLTHWINLRLKDKITISSLSHYICFTFLRERAPSYHSFESFIHPFTI